MWELDYKESWVLKNWCFWFVVLEKTLENPLDCKKIQPVHPKGTQSWIFTGRTDAEAEAPILWSPDAKSWLTGKDPDAGKDWRWEEKETTEDEMVGWHHRLNGHEFEEAPGVGDGQRSLVCCSPWGHKESDTTEWLNWTEYTTVYMYYNLDCFDNRSGTNFTDLLMVIGIEAGMQLYREIKNAYWTCLPSSLRFYQVLLGWMHWNRASGLGEMWKGWWGNIKAPTFTASSRVTVKMATYDDDLRLHLTSTVS